MAIKIDLSKKAINAFDFIDTYNYKIPVEYLTNIEDETTNDLKRVCQIIHDCNKELISSFKLLENHVNRTFEAYEEMDKAIANTMS